MRDVTDQMLDYAAVRLSVWNDHFRRRVNSEQRNALIDDFNEIDRLLLFSTIRHSVAELSIPDDFFLGESAVDGLELVVLAPAPHVDVLVTEERAGFSNRRWRHGLHLSSDQAMRIYFVEFFDWSQTGLLSGSLCRGRIVELEGQEELVGHDVLIELWRVAFKVRTPTLS